MKNGWQEGDSTWPKCDYELIGEMIDRLGHDGWSVPGNDCTAYLVQAWKHHSAWIRSLN